ncbi:pectin acetylesterase 8-like [Impatiens glandulifera]|uniref:pectin acetylesterase 8-like n=1 Tax=Impatiens glandulifera TaxID=253017 RepID=UPI001FB15220|nr:pectin acetylesterase 8-like [Impatiens glandulifera]
MKTLEQLEIQIIFYPSAKMGKMLRVLIVLMLELVMRIQGQTVSMTILNSAIAKGAVCLDGSPPGYHFDKGFGDGSDNWLLIFEGGGWCESTSECLIRKNIFRGSTNLMNKTLQFKGILNNQKLLNPVFYNWNRVKIRYCDGASFMADVEEVDPATNLHFRGARVFVAIIEDLLAKGLNKAHNALLGGCSAGGMSSIFKCDEFRNLLSKRTKRTKVKCLADAGYFINRKDIAGKSYIETKFNGVVQTHRLAGNLPKTCTSKLSPGLCFFPENIVKDIRTPLFILNAEYDVWQVHNILIPTYADPKRSWTDCKNNIANCSPTQLNTLQEFRSDFINALENVKKSEYNGLFINSCFVHCQTEVQEIWTGPNSSKLAGKTMAEAVGEWFYDKNLFRQLDCPYPCDKTCHNTVLNGTSPKRPNYIEFNI